MKLNNYKSGKIYKNYRLRYFIWHYVSALIFENSFFPVYSPKVFILRLFGAKIGKNLCIKTNVKIKFPWNLSLGDYVSLGENVWIDNLAKVTIGDNCCVSQGSYFCTGNHNYNNDDFDLITTPISLGNSVWIGAFCILSPGTICGDNLVLSAGSVCKGSLEGGLIYQGNPALATKNRGKN